MRKLDTNQSRDARLDETYYMLLPYLNTHTHPHNPMLQVYRTEDNCSADLHTLQQKKIVQLHRRSIQPTNQTPRALSLGGLRCLSIKCLLVRFGAVGWLVVRRAPSALFKLAKI